MSKAERSGERRRDAPLRFTEIRLEALPMIVLGLILLILGVLLNIGILWTIGVVLIIVGAILWILGSMDRAVMGRRRWY